MESIGDWLYVLILIIAGISSIFSSIRKKARQTSTQTQQTGQSQQTPAPPREIIKGDIFDDDFWGEKLPEKPAPVVKPQPKRKSYQTIAEQSNYFNQTDEGQSSIKTNTSPIFADNEEEYASITLDDIPSEAEEWRKVFVYNEIFNRKY